VCEFFRRASQDSHNRVVANAIVGLYLAGDAEARTELEQLATFTDAAFRCSAAWAMGRSGDGSFVSTLKAMTKDPEGIVRRSALRALVTLNKKAGAAEPVSAG
jgi:HEAT repeat protein